MPQREKKSWLASAFLLSYNQPCVRPPRIISLLPSATEIVCALGGRDWLVGRSHECDFPAGILQLPACTAPKVDVAATSGEIENQVRTLTESTTALFSIDAEKLRQLRPDVIITQAQCKVCAVNLAEVEEAVSGFGSQRPQVVALSPQRLADVWEDMRRVATALGIGAGAKDVLKQLKLRCVDVIEKACAAGRRPAVMCLEWLDPLMAAGNWVPDLVELAGGQNLIGEAGKHSPWFKWDELDQRDPEIIIAMPCGFDLARTRRELVPLAERPDWPKLRAVRNKQVYLTDGSQFFNRPGPRLVESLEILAEILHPQVFRFGHEGLGWQRL
jgi:iron complex transport system substrate-binding protein